MRIGGEAPGRRTHSFSRRKGHGGLRVTPPRMVAGGPFVRRAETLTSVRVKGLVVALRPLRPAGRRRPALRPWSRSATKRSTTFGRALRSSTCACSERPPSGPDTISRGRYLSESARNATPVGSCHDVPDRYPPGPVPSRAVGGRSRPANPSIPHSAPAPCDPAGYATGFLAPAYRPSRCLPRSPAQSDEPWRVVPLMEHAAAVSNALFRSPRSAHGAAPAASDPAAAQLGYLAAASHPVG